MKRHRLQLGEEHAEESYLASLSDLMVGMLFFFIILLMVFAINFRDAERNNEAQRRSFAEKTQIAEDEQKN